MKLPSQSDIQAIQAISDNIQSDDPCYIQFTSGTTGLPKGAVMSHFSCMNGAVGAARRFELSDGLEYHKICLQNPLFHLLGSGGGALLCLTMGATLCLPGFSFNAVESLEAIIKDK